MQKAKPASKHRCGHKQFLPFKVRQPLTRRYFIIKRGRVSLAVGVKLEGPLVLSFI